MTTLMPYLLFDGTCRKAMEFYHSCLGGELSATQVKDSPMRDYVPAPLQEKILNAHLKSANLEISASDWMRPDRSPASGNTMCIFLSSQTFAELQGFFDKLADGAEITDPLKQQPFGVYGALNDRFGVRWMFHSNEVTK